MLSAAFELDVVVVEDVSLGVVAGVTVTDDDELTAAEAEAALLLLLFILDLRELEDETFAPPDVD